MRQVAVLAGLLGAVVLFPADAQEPERRSVPETHFGAGSCAAQSCHGGGDAERMEYKVWASRDPHSRAYGSLESERGQAIGRRLGIDPTKAQACLVCHGAADDVRLADTYDVADGVSCEHCHGGAKDWLGPHAAPEWATHTRAYKARLGMRDLSTAANRAALCVTCHVSAPGREITHEIMAAGHPPLVFEAAKYLRDMPPHWTDEESLDVPAWIEGLEQSAAARLAWIGRAASRRDAWPEFAVFDCNACHHEIYTKSTYETTDPPGRPGDLPFDLAPLRVLLAATGDPEAARTFADTVKMTYAPSTDVRDLAKTAADLARQVAELNPSAHLAGRAQADAYLRNLDGYLAGIAAGTTRAPRHEMQLLAASVHSLAADRTGADFAAAWTAVDEALGRDRRYDARACAALVRKLLAAAR